MPRKRIELAIITVLVIVVIGYAGVGLVLSATRVAGAERTLNTVVSHENILNATFNDIDSQFSALSGSTPFNPQQAIVLIDRSISNSEFATKTINDDETSLRNASSQLSSTRWLTMVGGGSLDREATRIGHARSALTAAQTIASDKTQDGHFWRALYTSLADLTTMNTESGGDDFSAAKATLGTMKTDVDQAASLSIAPGLPVELRSLMTDLQTFVGDYGKQLDAKLAGDDTAAAGYQVALNADLQKIGAYDIDKIGGEINAFYKPLIERFNAEIAAATS